MNLDAYINMLQEQALLDPESAAYDIYAYDPDAENWVPVTGFIVSAHLRQLTLQTDDNS